MPLVFFTFSRVMRLTRLTTLDRYFPSRPPLRSYIRIVRTDLREQLSELALEVLDVFQRRGREEVAGGVGTLLPPAPRPCRLPPVVRPQRRRVVRVRSAVRRGQGGCQGGQEGDQ